ncbi:enterochelin esterase [Polymorphospora sp. NPDC051019]|uniref:enterochelin esterase n=1 Tax=Polymorphospora sp. NPDC051019 TaxID=3155725 RepID=UPI00342880F4
MPPRVVPGPRIETLRRDLASGAGPAVLAYFWSEVEKTGTPLVAPAPDDPGDTVLTFVWRERRPTRAVLLLVNKLADRADLGRSAMTRLPGTDLWHLTYQVRAEWSGSYQIAPDDTGSPDDAGRVPPTGPAYWRELAGRAVADPLNPETLPQHRPPHKSVAYGPATPRSGWWRPRPGVPAGAVDTVRVPTRLAGGPRRVWRYTPPGHRPGGGPYPLLVLLDGDVWGPLLPVAPTLDNLIHAGLLPPLVALMPDSVDRPTRFTEYACRPEYVEFLRTDLIGHAGADLAVTDDPARTVVAGQSLGGLTAAFAGLTAPDRFGNVLAQSGAFWWQSGTPDDAGAEWLGHEYAVTARRPLRLHLEVGLDEWVNLRPNRHLRDVLLARGYPVNYLEFAGGHDRLCWRERFGDALASLLGAAR